MPSTHSNRLNDPTSSHRVVLLVNKGTEGWNCPSLFATASRGLTTSNNFVLQAASRCLRQVPGNIRPARIYLSATIGPSSSGNSRRPTGRKNSVTWTGQPARPDATGSCSIQRRATYPHGARRTRQTLRAVSAATTTFAFVRPAVVAESALLVTALELGIQLATKRVLRAVGDAVVVEVPVSSVDLYSAAVTLAANTRQGAPRILRALRDAYETGTVEIPASHLPDLSRRARGPAQHV